MLIIGAKGFAKEVLEVLFQNKIEEDIYFFDNVNNDIPDYVYEKFKVIRTFEAVTELFKSSGMNGFTAGIGKPVNRFKLSLKFIELGGIFTSTISPLAAIGHFDNFIGAGSNIMTGSVLTNSIQIGKGALVNLNCTIGHDCTIGRFIEMSPGVHISGNCIIGEFVNIGTNATILPKIKIGDNVTIGAGAVVTKDIPSNSLAVGIPAKVIKEIPEIIF